MRDGVAGASSDGAAGASSNGKAGTSSNGKAEVAPADSSLREPSEQKRNVNRKTPTENVQVLIVTVAGAVELPSERRHH